MLGSNTDLQLLDDLATQLVVGNHAPDRTLKEQLRTTLAHLAGSFHLLTTNESGVAGVNLLPFLVSGETGLLGVDDDHVVTTINVRGKDCLVLATQEAGSFDGDIAEHFVGRINEMPRALDLFGFC